MKQIAEFKKVSYEQFEADWEDTFGSGEESLQDIYKQIALPKRATTGSAGYDFFSPIPFVLRPNEAIKIPTGVRANIDEGWMLQIYPRSGLGFKFRLQMNNTVGIIDSDYFFSDNEGHIFIKMTNDSREGREVSIRKGEAFAQGIFVQYGIIRNDEVTKIRNGGFGSTTI